jgi:hypothetical protein
MKKIIAITTLVAASLGATVSGCVLPAPLAN